MGPLNAPINAVMTGMASEHCGNIVALAAHAVAFIRQVGQYGRLRITVADADDAKRALLTPGSVADMLGFDAGCFWDHAATPGIACAMDSISSGVHCGQYSLAICVQMPRMNW